MERMTAEVIHLFPVGANADDTVRHTVKALMSGKGVSVELLAPQVNITVATFYRRLAGKGSAQAFRAGEVASLANALGVDVGQLYNGLNGTFVPPDGGSSQRASPTRWYSPNRQHTLRRVACAA